MLNESALLFVRVTVSPLYQEQLHTSFTEGQVTVHGIESDITIPAGSGPLLQITITGDWKSLMSEGSPLKQICISDIQVSLSLFSLSLCEPSYTLSEHVFYVSIFDPMRGVFWYSQGLGSHGIPLSINYGFDDTPQSCAKVSSDLLSIIAMDIDTDIPTSEKGRLHRTGIIHWCLLFQLFLLKKGSGIKIKNLDSMVYFDSKQIMTICSLKSLLLKPLLFQLFASDCLF